MKKLLFIYNPHAGKERIRSWLSRILDAFTQAGYLTTTYPTQGPGEATQITAAMADRYDLLVCSGGDGTLNEVVAGLMEVQNKPPLGYIPAGSTNDFSSNLHLPKGMKNAAAAAASGIPRPCDIGLFNGRAFIYIAAFGAFTDVSYGTPQQFKNMFGHAAYVMESLGRLANLKSYTITAEYDDGLLEGEFLFGMVSNTISVGGFKGIPSSLVSLDDGLFEVLLVRQPTSAAEFYEILLALTLQKPTVEGPVIAFRTSKLKLTCGENIPWTLDGEYGGDPEIAEIENCKHAITIIHGK